MNMRKTDKILLAAVVAAGAIAAMVADTGDDGYWSDTKPEGGYIEESRYIYVDIQGAADQLCR